MSSVPALLNHSNTLGSRSMERRNSQHPPSDDEDDESYDRSLPPIRDYFGAYLQGTTQAPTPDPRRAQLDPRTYATAAPQHAVPPTRAPYGVHPSVHPGAPQPQIQRSATPHGRGHGYQPGQQPARSPGNGYPPLQGQPQGMRPSAHHPHPGGGYPVTPPSGPAGGEYIILRPQVRSGSLQVAAASNQSFDAALAAYRQHEAQRAREQPSLEDLSDHDSDDGRSPQQIIAVRMARASSTPLFSCSVPGCDKRYTFASNLRRHVRTAHPEIANRRS